MVDISGGHTTGTVTFQTGTLSTTGALVGIRFDNADGTYNFNGAVSMTNPTDGVSITGDSDGNFTFANTTINTNGERAFEVVGGNAGGPTVNYTGGSITTSNASPFVADGMENGSVTFGPAVAMTASNDGSLIVQNCLTGTNTIDFDNTVTLGTVGTPLMSSAVFLSGNNSTTAVTFANLQSVASARKCIWAAGSGTLNITAGNLTNDAEEIIDIDGNTLGITLAGISCTNSAGSGIDMNNAGGTFQVTGTTTITNPADNGIDVTNSGCNITFADIDISTPGIAGINLDTNTGSFTANGGSIIYGEANDRIAINASDIASLSISGPDAGDRFIIDGFSGLTDGTINQAVYVYEAGSVTLDYLDISNYGEGPDVEDRAIYLDNITTSFSITNSVIDSVIGDGIVVEFTSGSGIAGTVTGTINGNTFTTLSDTGIVLPSVTSDSGGRLNLTVDSNTITAPPGPFISANFNNSSGTALNPNTLDFTNNNCTGTEDDGVEVTCDGSSYTDLVVSGNTNITGVGASSGLERGIYVLVDDSADLDITITDNSIDNFENEGIRLRVSGFGTLGRIDGLIGNNTITNCGGSGLSMDVDDSSLISCRVSGNTMASNGDLTEAFFGINIWAALQVYFSNNEDDQGYGIYKCP